MVHRVPTIPLRGVPIGEPTGEIIPASYPALSVSPLAELPQPPFLPRSLEALVIGLVSVPMPVVYETEDGERRNFAGIGYGLMKGDIKPDDIEPGPDQGELVIRGKLYRRVE